MKYFWFAVVLIFLFCSNVESVMIPDENDLKYQGDFEFVDEIDKPTQQQASLSERKKWIHDPSNDLCKPLNCKKKELCLLEDAYTAVCVSKKELHRNKDEILTKNIFFEEEAKKSLLQERYLQEDDDSSTGKDDVCKTCSFTSPKFLCGSDNKTYSSLCRIDYHNCLHRSEIKVLCKGFCPCRGSINTQKYERIMGRNENFHLKYKNTIEENTPVPQIQQKSAGSSSEYSFTPEDIKYDNKHYKYIKFATGSKKKVINNFSKQQDDNRQVYDYNDVLDKTTSKNRKLPKLVDCKPRQLTAIGNRLLDWFSVIMADSKNKRTHISTSKARFSLTCKTEAKWMFQHLDINSDGYLSKQELYDLKHDKNEKCIKPFINICDLNNNSIIDSREWCACFDHADRPCFAVLRRLKSDLFGSYKPDCDDQGFYNPSQCHPTGICWCVDKHGVEFSNTRTKAVQTKLNCEGTSNLRRNISGDDEEDDEEEGSNSSKLLVF